MPFGFSRPELLPLLVLLVPWVLLRLPRSDSGLLLAQVGALRRAVGPASWRESLVFLLPVWLRALTMAWLLLAMADPHGVRVVEVPSPNPPGRSIALAFDLSTSMLARDMGEGRSRLEVARDVIVRFAESRVDDELILVAFAGEALTRVSATTDRTVIEAGAASLDVDFLRNGTNISQAILASVAQLEEADREAKVLILLTDGAHNQAGVAPYAAARAALALGVRVHSISISSPEEGRDPEFGADGETVLAGISAVTGGTYFRAASAADLAGVFQELQYIESAIEAPMPATERQPWRGWFLAVALALFSAEVLFRGSRWEAVS